MLAEQIRLFATLTDLTKQEKIVKAITESISDGKYAQGDSLPSVNQLSKDLGYGRETVVKAYNSLKERGIISAKHGLGYFVSSEDPDQQLTIALVLYGFQTFQQNFYDTLRRDLGDGYNIDVFFHHNNAAVYDSIIKEIRLKYGMYIVAPIQSDFSEELLTSLPADKLLIVDRYLYVSDEVSRVTQEFEISMLRAFEELGSRIRDFSELILYYRDDTDYPAGIYDACAKWSRDNDMPLTVYKKFQTDHISPSALFVTVGDSDLWHLLKYAHETDLQVGKDIGIISHNDSVVKEFIAGGITTFSTDFGQMADRAASFVLERKKINEIIPSVLIRRGSL